MAVGFFTSHNLQNLLEMANLTSQRNIKINKHIPNSIRPFSHFIVGPGDEPSWWTGTKSRSGSIRGHSRLLKKRPNRQVTKRFLFGLAFFEPTSHRRQCSLFGLLYSRFSYPSLERVTSIRPRFLTWLIPSIGLRPQAASNRGRSIFRPRIRPLLDPA